MVRTGSRPAKAVSVEAPESPRKPARSATGQTPSFAGAVSLAVYVWDQEADELVLTETVGEPGDRHRLPGSCPRSARSPLAEAFRTGHPLWLSPAGLPGRDFGTTAPTPEPRGRASAAAASLGFLPLGGSGSVGAGTGRLGCLFVGDESGQGFDTERRGFLELYADQIAAVLEAMVAHTGVRTPPRPELDQLRVGSFTLAQRTGLLAADRGLLELFGIAADDFDGRVETLLARTVPDDVSTLMSLVEPGRISTDGSQLTFRVRRPGGELRWLVLRSRVLLGPDGVPDRMVGVVADALYLRPSADQVSMVQRLSTALAGAATVREVGQVVVDALRQPLGAGRVALAEVEGERIVVTLLDPPEQTAWPAVWRAEWRSEWPDVPAHALPTVHNALREGSVTLWPSGAALEPGLAGIGPGGLAVLPLPANGRIVGLCLVGWDTEHPFRPEERSLLTATAGLVGQALVRTHALDAEHELATMLQRSLLPRRLPALLGGVAAVRYLPATAGLDVGGDWYDVIPLSDGHVALVIGDVQGHSAGAATIMGQMRTAIRAYAVEGHPPDVVVAHANRLLVGMETDLFATCCYVDLDMEEGDAWLVRAGHLPPLLRHPDGSTEELLIEGGPPLGVIASAEFPMSTTTLLPGTVLTLLTDGLAESSELHLDDGLRQMRELLAAADPYDLGRMADDLLGGPDRRDDDVALLLLRYDGMRVRPVRAGWTVWRLPDAVLHARRFTARTLRSWNVARQVDVVLLLVSELVTNALVHTQGAVRLDLTLTSDRLRVAVRDTSPRTPVRPTMVDWEATGGRGIFLIEAMSDSWGSVPLSGGKQVWAEIALAPGETTLAR